MSIRPYMYSNPHQLFIRTYVQVEVLLVPYEVALVMISRSSQWRAVSTIQCTTLSNANVISGCGGCSNPVSAKAGRLNGKIGF